MASLVESFAGVVCQVETERRTLTELASLRGVVSESDPRIINTIQNMEAMVESLENKLLDIESFVDNEMHCLELLTALHEKSIEQHNQCLRASGNK
jgi:hypothetical protein